MHKRNPLLTGVLIILSLLAACAPPADTEPGERTELGAWFDAPLPGTILHPPSPCQVVAHASSPAGIASFELSINGDAGTIPSPDTNSTLVTLTLDCGVSEPGTYLLKVRALDNDGNWSTSAETTLIIPGDAAVVPPVEIGTPTPTPAPWELSITLVSGNTVYIGRTGCGPMKVSITAHAVAPGGITVVMLYYRFQAEGTTGAFAGVDMNPVGNDRYQVTLNPSSLLGGSMPFSEGLLQYQVVVQPKNGGDPLRTEVFSDITVKACYGG